MSDNVEERLVSDNVEERLMSDNVVGRGWCLTMLRRG